MYRFFPALVQRSRRQTSLAFYSSLRRARQLGPRSRVLNHIEPLRINSKRSTVLEEPKLVTNDALYYEKAAPSASSANTLVQVPIQENQVIKPDSTGAALLTQSALVVGRELEMMNVFLGYEQANKYRIMDPQGNHIGYIAEEEGFAKSISRQFFRTHRKMKATIMNAQGEVVFKIERPYSLVNSRIFIYTEDDKLVGEVQQRWHLMRRKYDLFIGKNQFATIDTPFLGWDFNLQDEQGGVLGNVSRNFVGFAREIFTDTGEYVLRMDAVEGNSRGMTLDERAVTLACAVSIDFDYFSRHSTHGGGGFLPFPMFGYGGGEREEPVNEEAPIMDGNRPNPTASTPPSTPQDSTTEWGDPWLSDEEAGVSNPDDGPGFFDTLSDFLNNDE